MDKNYKRLFSLKIITSVNMFPFWEIIGSDTVRLLGLKWIDDFKKNHAIMRKALDSWIMEVRTANWRGPHQIKDRYRTADFLSENRVIFNIKGNTCRLQVKINYDLQIVLVEWIGTHAEYDRKKFY